MQNRKIILQLILLLLLGVAVLFIFRMLRVRRMSSGLSPDRTNTTVSPLPKNQLVPSRPEDYGMVVIDDKNHPRTQGEWDSLISKKMKDLKEYAPAEVKAEISEKVKEDPQRTQEKLRQVDEKINKYQQMLERDPGNQDIRDTLERLMILKSISKELPKAK